MSGTASAPAYVENGRARLGSRQGSMFRSFPELTAAVAASLPVRDSILDGEIVHFGRTAAPASTI